MLVMDVIYLHICCVFRLTGSMWRVIFLVSRFIIKPLSLVCLLIGFCLVFDLVGGEFR